MVKKETIRYDWRNPGRDPRREKRIMAKKTKKFRQLLKVVGWLAPFGMGTL